MIALSFEQPKVIVIDLAAVDRLPKAVIAWLLLWPANGWPLIYHEQSHRIGYQQRKKSMAE
jgi:hypothetical protein